METNKVYSSIIKGLNEAIGYEKGKNIKGLKRKTVTISPLPHYSSLKIKEIRNILNLSQSTFATILGVSIKTVEAWESGKILRRVLLNACCGCWNRIIIY